jgi:MscS family membrane protein
MDFFINLFSFLRVETFTDRIITLGFIVIILFVIGKIFKKILSRVSNKHLIADHAVLAAFIKAMANSITAVLITLGIAIGLTILKFSEQYLDMVVTTREIIIVIGIAYFVFELAAVPSIWFEKLVEKQKHSVNRMFVPVIKKTVRLSVIILAIFQIIQIIIDKPITAIIAGLGIGGIAIALAAQDTIKHFIGSFVIAGDKPFEIGERVVVDGHDGPVESIGLRSTAIRTLEGHLVTIPNGELANRTIQNIGKRPFIRRLGNITITYDTPPEKIREGLNIIKKILENHEGMQPDLPPRVYFSGLNNDSLNILFLYWFHPPDYWQYMEFTEKVNFRIIEEFNTAGIDFAFPTQTIHLAEDKQNQESSAPKDETSESES